MDYNMLLGKYVPPPADHWAKAASAGNLTPEQLQSIGTLLQLVKPRLQVGWLFSYGSLLQLAFWGRGGD
jgi:hypothetical protein